MKWKAYSQRSWYRGDWPRPRPNIRLKWILILLFAYLIGLVWRMVWLSTSTSTDFQEPNGNEVPSMPDTEHLASREIRQASLLANQLQTNPAIDKPKLEEDDKGNSNNNLIETRAKKEIILEDRHKIRANNHRKEKQANIDILRNNREKLSKPTEEQNEGIVVNAGNHGDTAGSKNDMQSNDGHSQLKDGPMPASVEEELNGCEWNKYIMPPIFSNPSQRVEHPWLLITIPTVARSRPYLALVLSSIANQLPKSNFIQVAVVHNLHPTRKSNYSHETYQIEREFREKDHRFHFVDLVNTLPVVDGPEEGGRNVPGEKVRAQTRDLVNTLTLVHNRFNPKYMLFMEDDFLLCKEGLSTFIYIIRRMNEQWNASKEWNLVRFSFGFNGFILQRDDIQTLADYLLKHQVRRPPDHLLVEWFAGETTESAADKRGRVHASYRYNLLDHLGQHSTLRDGLQPNYMRCWQPLTFPTIFEVEVFKNECSKQNNMEDLWPCSGAAKMCPPWTFVSRAASLM